MAKIVCCNSDGTAMSHLTQWDKNLTLVVKGADISSAPDFHFSNKKSTKALVVKSIISGGDISAKIPNVLLQDDLPINVYMYYTSDDGSAITRYTTVICVVPRAQPDDYEYSESGFQYSDCIQFDSGIIINDTDPGGKSLLWIDTGSFDE